jgi:hypothetical protein
MREELSEVRLWIDAICINQSDKEERNVQVQRMGDIFRQATGVRVWLGEEYEQSNRIMDWMKDVNSNDLGWNDTWYEHTFPAFRDILSRPWFQRGWIIQEAAFARKLTIYCGDRQVEWRQFAEAVAHVAGRMMNPQSSALSKFLSIRLDEIKRSPAQRLLDIMSAVFSQGEGGLAVKQMTLEELVDLGTHFETTDARDSVYALVNLAKSLSHNPASINLDYRKDTLTVFVDFVDHCIQSLGSLDIVCRSWAPTSSLTVPKYDTQREPEIPSWIQSRDRLPFGIPSRRYIQRLHSNSLVGSCQARLYNAHSNILPEARIHRCDERGLVSLSLSARGVVLGTVDCASLRMAGALVSWQGLNILELGRWKERQGEVTIMRILCADLLRRQNMPQRYETSIVQYLQGTLFDQPMGLGIDGEYLAPGLDVDEVLETDPPAEVRHYLELVRQCIWNRRTFRGNIDDYMQNTMRGLIPQTAKVGDTICILYGCSVPMVLRKMEG